MQRVVGTILFVGLLVGAFAALISLVVRDPAIRVPIALGAVAAGYGIQFVLSRPRVSSHRVAEKYGVAGMATVILIVVAANAAPDIVWVVFIGVALGLITPTLWTVLRREWSTV